MSRCEKLRDHFDRLAPDYCRYYEDPRPDALGRLLQRRRSLAMGYFRDHLQPGAKILDAGCGTGSLSLELAQRGYCVHGIDISPAMVQQAEQGRRRLELTDHECRFEQGDVVTMGLSKASYDGIAGLAFLEYQENPFKALAILNRLLKPGGTLVLSVPNTLGADRCFGLARAYERLTGRSLSLSLHCFTVERIQRVLGMAGFIMMAYQRHGFIGPTGQEMAIPGWASRLANEIVTCARTYRPEDTTP
ncbi:MAG: class I SAM-dependent methyltransferase [Vulcanimicrobiota bacterium]